MADKKGGPHASTTATHTPESVIASIKEKARARVTPERTEALEDPQILHRRGEAVLNELEREQSDEAAQRKIDDTYRSALLTDPATGVLWKDLLAPVLDQSRIVVEGPGAHPPQQPGVDPGVLKALLGDADSVRNRTMQACTGADASSPESVARRAAIFGRPPFSPSKPAWENELKSMVIAIQNAGEHQTFALKAMVPQIQKVIDALEKVTPAPGGRPASRDRWSEDVVAAQEAIAIVLDGIVQWSAAVATPARNAAILRITNPKRRAEDTGDATKKAGTTPKKSDSDTNPLAGSVTAAGTTTATPAGTTTVPAPTPAVSESTKPR